MNEEKKLFSTSAKVVVAATLLALYLISIGPVQVHVLKQESQGKWSRADQIVFEVIYCPIMLLVRCSDSAHNLFYAYARLWGADE